jgi:hypothetical protein
VGEDGYVDEGGVGDSAEVVEGAHDTRGVGARQEGGIGENVQDHVRGAENLSPIAVSRDIAQQTAELGHGVDRGAKLGAGKVASGGQDPPVDAPAIVQQIAYGYLKFFALGRCSEGGQVGSGTLGRGGAIVRRFVKGRIGGWFDVKGTKTLEERINVSGVGDGKGALGEVVGNGTAEELVGDRVGLDMIEGRQGRDEVVEVGEIGRCT